MSEISRNFGLTSPKYETSWSREILFQNFSNLPIGKLNQIKLNFSFRHGTANTSTNAIIRIFSDFDKNWNISGWPSHPASYWWETRIEEQSNEYAWDKNKVNNGDVPGGYQYKSETASNFKGTILAEGKFLINRGTETQVNTTVTFFENHIQQTELSSWNQKLYLAIYSEEDVNNTTWLWPVKFSPTITFVYSQESNGELDSSIVDLGDSSTITIDPTDSSYSHKVCWFCGNKNSEWQTVLAGTTSCSYKIPKLWGEVFPSSQSYQGTVQLQTYSGNSLVGTKTYSITYKVPDYSLGVEGAISGFEHDVSYQNIRYFSGSSFDNKRNFLTSRTKATCTINIKTDIEQRCGAEIKSYTVRQENSSGGIISSSSSFSFKGDIPCSNFHITVVDTRGKNESITLPLNKITYLPPQITKIEAYRIKSTTDKEKDEAGGLACLVKVTIANATSSVNGVTNTTSCTIKIGNTTFSNETEVVMDLSADASAAYTITVTDTAGAKIVTEGTISSLSYLLHFKKNIQSMGIGCAAPSTNNQLDIAWPVNLKGGIKDLSFSSGLTQQGLLEKLGVNNYYLSLNGGTLAGNLIIYKDWPSLFFKMNATHNGITRNEEVAFIQPAVTGALGFYLISPGADIKTYEGFALPAPTRTDNYVNNILTDKYAVTVEQGGTGANNSPDALKNLGIIYNNSSTLPVYDKEKHDGRILLVPIF